MFTSETHSVARRVQIVFEVWHENRVGCMILLGRRVGLECCGFSFDDRDSCVVIYLSINTRPNYSPGISTGLFPAQGLSRRLRYLNKLWLLINSMIRRVNVAWITRSGRHVGLSSLLLVAVLATMGRLLHSVDHTLLDTWLHELFEGTVRCWSFSVTIKR